MPSYTAPLEDMMFLFEKLRDNKKYNELEKYKEVSSDLVKDILEEAAKINQNLILPLAKAGDENPAVLENGVVRTPPGYKEAYNKDQLMAGTDCGFSTFAGFGNVDENIVYKKLESLVIGTELASKAI